MSRNPDLTLNPEWMEEPCDVRTSAQSFSTIGTKSKCQVVNERKCATSGDQHKCDEAHGVTAISDQDVFRKEVGTNFQLFITFGQQCTAVLEDEERRDVFVSVKTFIIGGVIKFLHVGVVKIVNRFVNIVLVGLVMFILCGVVKVILLGFVKHMIKEMKM